MSIRTVVLWLNGVVALFAWLPDAISQSPAGPHAGLKALEQRVAALEAAIFSPTAASIVGTYDVFEVSIDVDSSSSTFFSIAGSAADGTAVFNADGTADVNMTKQYRQLVFDVTRADNVATGVNNSTNVSCCRSIDSTSVQLRDQPEVDNGRQGWSFSNGVVTIGDTAFIVVGRLLLGRILSTDGEGHNGLVILARRSP